MVGRKIRDADDAAACLRAVEGSGQSRAAWARANGVDARSLHMWKLNLDRGRGSARPRTEAPSVRLVEVMPTSRREASYLVHVGSFTVEVDEDFDDEVLARLLAVVARC